MRALLRAIALALPLTTASAPLYALAESTAADAPSSVCPPHCQPAEEPMTPAPIVDLNKADESALLDLPGIGPARARAILEYRKSHGPFRSLSQLLHIKGIGRSMLKQLRPLVTL
ncbi:MAG: helix-hairpin-helix protein [Myxococcaceae bacterium]|nr:helix-hairpin-helix protein [Myxococcaceae bacterium]